MTKNFPILPHRYSCDSCNIKTNNKKDFEKHITTLKHMKLTKVNKMETTFSPNNIVSCKNCNKVYKSRVGLWKHSKICVELEKKPIDSIDLKDKDSLILQLLQQNGELQKSLIELSKEKSITNNTHNNSHNKTFNLNFFLNETCKDALNIQDFVSSIKLSLEDLEHTGRQGYIEGISNIILKKLKGLEQYKRPIHCSDLKREILYIKNENQWIKECEEKPILTKAIKVIANENIKQIQDWREKNPECTHSESKKNNLYLKIVSNSMNGSSQEESDKNISKIISNVAKETIIDK